MTPDEPCARCGDPLPGANPDNLDVCVPCDTIVSLEVERDELLAKLERVREFAAWLADRDEILDRDFWSVHAAGVLRAALGDEAGGPAEPP